MIALKSPPSHVGSSRELRTVRMHPLAIFPIPSSPTPSWTQGRKLARERLSSRPAWSNPPDSGRRLATGSATRPSD
eukprot:2108304-Pyramimonas_sp.AAC.1